METSMHRPHLSYLKIKLKKKKNPVWYYTVSILDKMFEKWIDVSPPSGESWELIRYDPHRALWVFSSHCTSVVHSLSQCIVGLNKCINNIKYGFGHHYKQLSPQIDFTYSPTRSSGSPESYRQVSLIRFGAELCRKMDLEGQSLHRATCFTCHPGCQKRWMIHFINPCSDRHECKWDKEREGDSLEKCQHFLPDLWCLTQDTLSTPS